MEGKKGRLQNRTDAPISNAKRLKQIVGILSKHSIIKGLTPGKLIMILEDLGPTFIKLGQIMSMRSDILPKKYCEELKKLRSEVAPISYGEVKMVIEASCGTPITELFKSFEREPLGSASIAQVHRAQLPDGTDVVVKVQRLGIHETMSRDIALMKRAARLLKVVGGMGEVLDFDTVLDELWAATQEEMNFLHEASNVEEFYQLNSEMVYVTCPKIFKELTTATVLVMEYIEGCAINDFEALAENKYDINEIGLKLADNYVKQIVDDGFFHADPHPGNIRIRDGQIVWIDLGMMGRMSARDQKMLAAAIEAIAKRDVGAIKEVVLSRGVCRTKVAHGKLYTDIEELLSQFGSLEMGSMDLAVVIDAILDVSKAHKIAMPSGIFMMGRGITAIQGVLAEVSPDINFVQIMENHLAADFLLKMDWKKVIRDSTGSLLQSAKKALDIPALILDVLNTAMKGQGKLCMELTPSDDFKKTANKLVNKLNMGILAAALLLGSSLLCTTNMSPKILGIPAIGVIGYVVSFALCLYMFIDSRRNK